MTPSNVALDLIKSQEGCILHPYLDIAEVPTIGWGTTVYPSGKVVTMRDPPISQSDADFFLFDQVSQKAAAVGVMITAKLSQNQFDALVDFAYNVGTGALHGSTLLRWVNTNPANLAIRTAFLMWDKYHYDGVLLVSADLKARRTKEADLYFS